jgi:hypothetical protein
MRGQQPAEGALDEPRGIDRREGTGDNRRQVLAERRQSGVQWTFLGSDQPDRPVTRSILRSSRPMTWSASFFAQS